MKRSIPIEKELKVLKLNQQQRRYLLDRIGRVRYPKFTPDQEPGKVAAARAIADAWDAAQERKRNALIYKFQQRKRDAHDAILFATPDEALRLVREFEANS